MTISICCDFELTYILQIVNAVRELLLVLLSVLLQVVNDILFLASKVGVAHEVSAEKVETVSR